MVLPGLRREAKGQDAMKHPGPWTIPGLYAMQDANGAPVADVLTLDPETRAILTHAAEMWEAMCAVGMLDRSGDLTYHYLHDPEKPGGDPLSELSVLVDAINAEIAAAKGDGT